VLRSVAEAARRHGKPLTLCGELASRPLEAMALVGVGLRAISMAPAAIGPVKAMILSLDAGRLGSRIDELLAAESGSLREELQRFAAEAGVELA
jgi:phosphotransferase system enzyme I (PtsP)